MVKILTQEQNKFIKKKTLLCYLLIIEILPTHRKMQSLPKNLLRKQFLIILENKSTNPNDVLSQINHK